MSIFQVTNIFFLCDIVLQNGTKFYITNQNENVNFQGNDYLSKHGMKIVKLKKDITVGVDELDLQFFLDELVFKIDDLQKNLFQNAAITLFRIVNSNQKKIIFVGEVTKIEIDDHQFTMKVASQKQKLFTTICKLFSPTCRASLGDAQCKVNLDDSKYKISGNVTAVAANQMSITCDTLKQDNGYFDYGYIVFNKNTHKTKIVVRNFFQGGNIFLNSKPIFTIKSNDSFEIFPGCDKKFSTCKSKFSNWVNFQGEPKFS